MRRIWFSKVMFEEIAEGLWLLEHEIKDNGLEGSWETLVAIWVSCSSVLAMVDSRDGKGKVVI